MVPANEFNEFLHIHVYVQGTSYVYTIDRCISYNEKIYILYFVRYFVRQSQNISYLYSDNNCNIRINTYVCTSIQFIGYFNPISQLFYKYCNSSLVILKSWIMINLPYLKLLFYIIKSLYLITIW